VTAAVTAPMPHLWTGDAAAGIAYYWRIELEPGPRLVAHEAAGDTYRMIGEFTGLVRLEAPWPVAFDLRELVA
jgi:hypothetical protein